MNPPGLDGLGGPIRHRRAAVLMVDDDDRNLLALASVLEDLDADLVKASSGPEALRELLVRDFAVVLLDINMPGMDGIVRPSGCRRRCPPPRS